MKSLQFTRSVREEDILITEYVGYTLEYIYGNIHLIVQVGKIWKGEVKREKRRKRKDKGKIEVKRRVD